MHAAVIALAGLTAAAAAAAAAAAGSVDGGGLDGGGETLARLAGEKAEAGKTAAECAEHAVPAVQAWQTSGS